jgi:azurin
MRIPPVGIVSEQRCKPGGFPTQDTMSEALTSPLMFSPPSLSVQSPRNPILQFALAGGLGLLLPTHFLAAAPPSVELEAVKLGVISAEAKTKEGPSVKVHRVKLQVVPNLVRFDTKQFDVLAGSQLEVTLKNGCVVPHNIVFLESEAEAAVIAGVNSMGVDGMSKNYVPEVPGILASSKLLAPNQTQVLRFTVPTKPGAYLFLCTFPGHWFTMRGTMRVRLEHEQIEAPIREKIKTDFVPDALQNSGVTHLPKGSWEKPLVMRTFLADPGLESSFFSHHGVGKDALKYDPNTRRDMTERVKDPETGTMLERPIVIHSIAGIAAPIAVSHGDDFAYAWDTTECRLLFAWRGGFLNMNPYWGKEPGGNRGKVYLPELIGNLVYRASGGAPLGGADAPVFGGYKMVDGAPEFFYRMGQRNVRERVVPRRDGKFEIRIQCDGEGSRPDWKISDRDTDWVAIERNGADRFTVVVRDREEESQREPKVKAAQSTATQE